MEILIDPDTRRDKLIVATRRESSCRCHVLQSLMGCRMCAFWRTWVRDDVDLVLSSAQVSPLERRFEHCVIVTQATRSRCQVYEAFGQVLIRSSSYVSCLIPAFCVPKIKMVALIPCFWIISTHWRKRQVL